MTRIRNDLILLDGGTGRELQRIGAPFAQPEWSALALIEAPDFVRRVHQAYLEAGADVLTTNSYALVPFHIGEARFAAEGRRLAALAGRLARDVADLTGAAVTIAGSLPPVCGSYRADLFDPDQARPILETLVDGLAPLVDHWLAETLSTLQEAHLVRRVLAGAPGPLWLSFTLADEPGCAAQLRSGQSVKDAALTAMDLGAAALLFNCSRPEVMAGALEIAADTLARRGGVVKLGAYANAFGPQNAKAQANENLDALRQDLTAEDYLAFARTWRDCGAQIIGGCCGVGPEHIALLRAHLA